MSRVGETKKVVVPVRVRPVRRMGEDILRGLEKNGEDGKGSKGSTKLATRCLANRNGRRRGFVRTVLKTN